MRAEIVAVHDVANGVGESPVWDDGILRWVDITGRAVHGLGKAGGILGFEIGKSRCVGSTLFSGCTHPH